ncbi:hypothetical protein [Nonlabens xiamenensis]|uniref:hypothetical protein n=1 Tax=Nonlabens xiamenensis TaxID=2341043 RepID=UPI0013DE194D|nr:hypothetical protein [Nonlabens xiamenensis]
MKKILFLSLLLIPFISWGQYRWTEAVVTLNNGKTLTGEAKIPLNGAGFTFGLKN